MLSAKPKHANPANNNQSNGLGKDNWRISRESYIFFYLVCLTLEFWRNVKPMALHSTPLLTHMGLPLVLAYEDMRQGAITERVGVTRIAVNGILQIIPTESGWFATDSDKCKGWFPCRTSAALSDRYASVPNLHDPSSSPHGAHLRPTGPRWTPCGTHENCYLGIFESAIC